MTRQQDTSALLDQFGNALVAVHTASNEDDTPLVDLMAPDLFGLVTEAVAAYSSCAALPPSAPAALDVERLARALEDEAFYIEDDHGDDLTYNKAARRILARLAQGRSPEPSDG